MIIFRDANYKKDDRFAQLRAQFYDRATRTSRVFTQEAKNMTHNCANEFRLLLIWNILTGKFDSFYRPLSPVYKKWKDKQEGAEQGFWKLWGTLQLSFQVRPTPKGYSIGVDKAALPQRTSSWGTKKKLTPVWMYFWYGEKGRLPFSRNGMNVGEQPPRPVFSPTIDEYRPVFNDKRSRDVLDKVKRTWIL